MSKPVIEIKKLSKAYMIGHEREAMAGTMIQGFAYESSS